MGAAIFTNQGNRDAVAQITEQGPDDPVRGGKAQGQGTILPLLADRPRNWPRCRIFARNSRKTGSRSRAVTRQPGQMNRPMSDHD